MPTDEHCPLCSARRAIPASPLDGDRCLRRSPRREGKTGIWVIGGIVVAMMLVGVVVIVDWALDEKKGKDSKQVETPRDEKPPKVEGPQILIDEDFQAAYKDKLPIPKDWTEGEAFRVVKLSDLASLEVSKPSGMHFVKLPPVVLTGDFAIECFYRLGRSQTNGLVLRLQDRARLAMLPIAVNQSGRVVIGNDQRAAPPGFKRLQPTKMLIKREGKKVSVLLNGDLVGSKSFDAVAPFDTIKIGLTGGADNAVGRARLLGIRVTSLTP